MRWIRALLLCLGLALTACSQQQALDKITPHPESEQAQDILKQLRHRQFDAIKAKLEPALRSTPNVDTELGRLADHFPPGDILSSKVVGVHIGTLLHIKDAKATNYSLTYEYQFPHQWLLANVTLRRENGMLMIVGLNVQPETASLAERNAFTLSGKSAYFVLFLAAACMLPLFCIATFIVCLRTPIRRRKWLWAIATMLGCMSVSLNWSTGALHLQLLVVQWLSASAFAPLNGPWMLSISMPLGAIAFWIVRGRLKREALAARTPPRSGVTSQDQV